MYMLRLNEISEALYLWIKLDLKGQNIVDKMFSQLDNVAHIPKSAFIKSLFCFTLKDRYEKTF